MKIQPREESYFKNILDEGVYDFTVHDSCEKTSKSSGEKMIELILHVQGNNKRKYTIFDYLMDKPPSDAKIFSICSSLGLMEMYNSGEINPISFKNKIGKAKISIRKDQSGIYGDKNVVVDYLSKSQMNDPDLPF